MSHYHWLEKHLPKLFKDLGLNWENNKGIISCHGDKCYSYRSIFEKNNIPFEHGVAIYLLTYVSPFEKETRRTVNGWVDPCKWIINNYNRFKPFLPDVNQKR